MNGRENDLVKMQGVPDCKPPAKGEGRKPNLIPSDRITLEKIKNCMFFRERREMLPISKVDPLKGSKRKRKSSQAKLKKKQKVRCILDMIEI